ncbi:hypothetical protein [Nocardia sp. IFM 10818]
MWPEIRGLSDGGREWSRVVTFVVAAVAGLLMAAVVAVGCFPRDVERKWDGHMEFVVERVDFVSGTAELRSVPGSAEDDALVDSFLYRLPASLLPDEVAVGDRLRCTVRQTYRDALDRDDEYRSEVLGCVMR